MAAGGPGEVRRHPADSELAAEHAPPDPRHRCPGADHQDEPGPGCEASYQKEPEQRMLYLRAGEGAVQ